MSNLPFRVKGCMSITICLVIVNGLSAVNAAVGCSLLIADESLPTLVEKLLQDENTYMIRYNLQFTEHRQSPLANSLRQVFHADSYNRIRKRHGQMLLALAFNYGVISLRTLTIGTSDVMVSVYESPTDCLSGLSETETLDVVLYLLARDLNSTNQNVSIQNEERICLQYIEAREGVAYFKPRCYSSGTVNSMADPGEIGNKWIDVLYILIAVVKVVIICFGPLLFIDYVSTLSQESVPYVVKLREPLQRTLFVAKRLSDFKKVRGARVLNLTKCRGYPKLKRTLENTPFGRPFQAQISEYDILAVNSRLIMENEVPVTFWGALAEAIFRCKMKNVGPFQSCCYVDMYRDIPFIKRSVPWINFWKKVGNMLLILFLPFLYYLRLILFYLYEYQELKERRAAAERLGLRDSFDNSLLHYLSPTHWVFIAIYVVYFVSAFTMAYLTRSDDEGRFRNIVVGSFSDLRRLSYIRVFQLMVENFIWPFKRYGIIGCFVAIVYWPIVLPLTFVVYIFYSIPTIYLTFRMFFYSRRAFLEQFRTHSGIRKYQATKKEDYNLHIFQVDNLFETSSVNKNSVKPPKVFEEVDELERFRAINSAKEKPDDTPSIAPSIVHVLRIRPLNMLRHLVASITCILALCSLLIIVAECLGSLVEIVVFTMMGVIVNAGVTVKYGALVIQSAFYTYISFNNVHLRYLKLNRSLFIELKSRVKELDNVTSLPSYLQENQAFKAQEHSEQGSHEKPDSIAKQPPRYWFINDLVLFVDNEDTFRIPRKLFKAVCEIRAVGVPGPIYEGVMEAVNYFLRILVFIVFVFLVILAFGEVYELSSTTQTVAILASGFLPVIVKTCMQPKKPEVEVSSLSFKSKLDEVVKNFWQLWPIYDFSFTPLPDPEPDEASAVDGAKPYTATMGLNGTQNNNNSTVYQVDLLIKLPSHYEDEWVDGWSNIIQVQEVKQKRASEVAEAMVEASDERTGQTD